MAVGEPSTVAGGRDGLCRRRRHSGEEEGQRPGLGASPRGGGGRGGLNLGGGKLGRDARRGGLGAVTMAGGGGFSGAQAGAGARRGELCLL